LTALLVAAVPLVAVAVAMIGKRHEPLGRTGALGMAVGVAGVALLVGVDVSGSQWSAVAEMLVVTVCYAVGASLLARWFTDLPGAGVVALSLTAAALGYLPFALPGLPHELPSTKVVVSVVLLAVVCTAGAFLLLIALIGEIGPVRATTITYVNPAVAVAAGAIVLDEPITLWTVAGFAAVIVGSALVNRRRPAPRPLDEAGACPAPVTAAG
jgi:drug/metabolite transporter (DMT)-like permease